jgi:hypothetical protein
MARAYFIFASYTARRLVGISVGIGSNRRFLLVSAVIDEENYFTFKWLWQWSSIGQGHQQRFDSPRVRYKS